MWCAVDKLSDAALNQLLAELTAEIIAEQKAVWPDDVTGYINNTTGRHYKPHSDAELAWVLSDEPRYPAALGGEGSGKSVAGIIKTLERIRRGMRGAMVSPDLPHFKKSLWPEFRAWCPENVVVSQHRYRLDPSWEPQQMFTLTFLSRGQLLCGGLGDPISWEGPNLHFAHIDEIRRMREPTALKTLDGRVRIVGRNNVQPQLWITTTPRKHWLYDYYGPIILNSNGQAVDPRNPNQPDQFISFKEDVRVIQLRTQDNEENTFAGFANKRGQSLTEDEKRLLLEGEWEDPSDTSKFLDSITLWDLCQDNDLPPSTRHTPLVAAIDAGVSNDNFGFVAVSRHPKNKGCVAVRHVKLWQPPRGGKINFQEVEDYIVEFCKNNAVVELVYDPYQLHFMSQRLTDRRAVFCQSFPQGNDRLEADKGLLDTIYSRRIAHKGEADLRAHLDNANRKLDLDEHKLRIVKRADNLKIDLAVCLSMATYRCLTLNL